MTTTEIQIPAECDYSNVVILTLPTTFTIKHGGRNTRLFRSQSPELQPRALSDLGTSERATDHTRVAADMRARGGQGHL